jgi:hypothetical protein
MAGARVLHWNGKDLPEELRELPAGTYVVEAIDKAPTLTPDEEKGLGADRKQLDHDSRGRRGAIV